MVRAWWEKKNIVFPCMCKGKKKTEKEKEKEGDEGGWMELIWLSSSMMRRGQVKGPGFECDRTEVITEFFSFENFGLIENIGINISVL